MRAWLLLPAALLLAPAAMAQTSGSQTTVETAGGQTMAQLLTAGYEIRTSVLNGTQMVVFMQKDKSAYACEFVSVTRSRCAEIK
jgi:hypothetical protein